MASDVKEAFEKWSRKEGYFIDKDSQGIYISFTMQRWQGYQAALVYAREWELVEKCYGKA